MLEGRHIYLIEDDISSLAMITTILKHEGAKVSRSPWGEQTLKTLSHLKGADLILLDLHFPGGVSGYDVMRKIQADSELQDIPVVIVSGSDPDKHIEKAKEMGFRGYIYKPVSRRTLGTYLSRVLQGEEIWMTQDMSRTHLL